MRAATDRFRQRLHGAAAAAVRRLRRTAPGAVEAGRQVADEWRTVRIGGLAAEVAFFAVLSIFPALVAVGGALGSLDSLVGRDLADSVEAEVVAFLQRVLSSEAAGTIAEVEALFEQGNTGLVTLSTAGAVWAASRGFAALIKALDVVFHVEERRSYLRLRVIALALALGTIAMGVVVLAVVVVGPLLGNGQDLAEALGFGQAFAVAWDWARWPVAALALLTWASALMRIAPNRNEPLHLDLVGAVVAAGLWALSTVGLRLYLAAAGGTNQVLGVLGGPLIVLVWLYLLALGLLFGGVCNHLLERRRRAGPRLRGDSGVD